MKTHAQIKLLFSFSLLILGGCATTLEVPSSERTRILNTSYSKLFPAIIQVFSEQGYLIDTADQDNGLITTDYSDFSTGGAVFSAPRRIKVNAVLRSLDQRTQLRLAISVQSQDASGWEAASMNKRQAQSYYTQLFDRIDQQLE